MLVTPTLIVKDITTIEPQHLLDRGIKGVILDLDNTIMAPRAGLLTEKVQAWLDGLSEAGLKCMVVSNNPREWYIEAAGKVLDMPVIGNAGKPRRKHLRQGLKLLNVTPAECVIIGDRPLTDIWGGQRLGAHTILVDPLIKLQEPWYFKAARWVEYQFVRPAAEML